jgi:uncharacterized membrane protein YczE
MNIKNGLQVLVLVAALIFGLIIAMTALLITDHTVPSTFSDALFSLIGAIVGGSAVHLSVQANQPSSPSGGP